MKGFVTLGVVLAGALLAGCGAAPKNMATKQDLAGVEKRLNQKVNEEVVALKNELADAKGKLPEILTAEAQVSRALEDLGKMKSEVKKDMKETKTLVREARGDMLRILEAEEKLLTDRLGNLREVIRELRKRQGKK